MRGPSRRSGRASSRRRRSSAPDPCPPRRPGERPVPRSAELRLSMAVGAVFLIVPPLLPAPVRPWMFGFVWLGFVLLLDPLNARSGAARPSWPRGGRAIARSSGDGSSPGSSAALLWEFWNYWALARWRYVGVPVFPAVKLFEMPLAGYLGFPPFALEVFAMYHFVRPLIGPPEPDARHRTAERLTDPYRRDPRRTTGPWRRSVRSARRRRRQRANPRRWPKRPAEKTAQAGPRRSRAAPVDASRSRRARPAPPGPSLESRPSACATTSCGASSRIRIPGATRAKARGVG